MRKLNPLAYANRSIEKFFSKNKIDSLCTQQEIFENLMQLRQMQCELRIHTHQAGKALHGKVMEVDLVQQQFTFETEATETPSTGSRLEFTGTLRGRGILFESELLVREMTDRGAQLTCPLPSAITRIQRRRSFRIPFNKYDSVPTLVIDDKDYGTVLDISRDSLHGDFDHDLREKLHEDDLLTQCKIRLDDETEIPCNLTVKRVLYDNRDEHTHIGSVFTDLTPENKNRLENFITRIERDHCQRIARMRNRHPSQK